VTIEVRVEGATPITEGACRVVAEAGANHNNSVERAIEMAHLAQKAGAWGVKYQLYKADRIAVKDSPKYWSDDIGTSSQFEAFTLSDRLDYDSYGEIAKACREMGIVFFATPFDLEAIDALERMQTPIYKVASADITYKELLQALGTTGKPVVLSTGASTPEEIAAAIEWTGYGPDRLVLLACTLTYPTPDPDGNFARIEELREQFGPYLVGQSDHTLGTAGAWMTAALGGVMLEKHYTIDKKLPDVPDHAMSVTPDELAELVLAADRAAVLRGSRSLAPVPSELPARDMARRSVVLEQDVPAGSVLTAEHLSFKRPGTGLAPARSAELVGRTVKHDLRRGHLIDLSDLEA
jgi:sialic acid synthase SpsE